MTSKCIDCKHHKIVDVAYNRKLQGLIIRHSCDHFAKDIYPLSNSVNYCNYYEQEDIAKPADAPSKKYEVGEEVTV